MLCSFMLSEIIAVSKCFCTYNTFYGCILFFICRFNLEQLLHSLHLKLSLRLAAK